MADRRKIGPRIDADVWERFRDDVQERKGQTRGVLGDELEKAILEYIGDERGTDDREIKARLQRIEAAVGAAPTDGGTDTSDATEHTHAPSRLDVDEKPAANAATDKKVAYLAERVRDDHAGKFREVPRSHLVDVVKGEYGFRSDTCKRYVDRLADYFGLQEHPMTAGLLVTPDRYEELVEEQRDEARQHAEETFDAV